MSDVTIKIPLPEGTRFLEGGAEPATSTNFDGREVTFFTSAFHRPIRNAFFTVEVTDPTKTDFAARAWITWKGDQPGDYLTQDVIIDISREPLNWDSPPPSPLQLNAMAVAADDVLTYYIYPVKTNWRRMWDLKINIVIPDGTTFLDAKAPPPFVANFDGREVSFSIVELERAIEIAPLSFRVSTTEVTENFLVTRAWASWKNAGRGVGQTVVSQDETISGDIVVQPNVVQHVISDPIGDVPFLNYDLTSIAFIENETDLQINFYTAGNIDPKGTLEYTIYVDEDCNINTGSQRRGVGAEYVVNYNHKTGQADLVPWDQDRKRWDRSSAVTLNKLAAGKMVAIWVPYHLLKNRQQFCWIGRSDNRIKIYEPAPPSDWIPDSNLPQLTRYESVRKIVWLDTNEPDVTKSLPTPIAGQPENTKIAETENKPGINSPIYYGYDASPSSDAITVGQPASVNGKLAVPIDNGQVNYDISIFSLPDGRELARIPNARQPNFHLDGQRLLINKEGGGTENLYEYNLTDNTVNQVSDAPRDSFPFYDRWGNRVVYSNPELVVAANGQRRPFIFVQCSLQPPHLEVEPRCRDIAGLGVLVPAGQMGEIQGTHPLWTADDMIAYKGCNTWAGSRLCGIYVVPSASTKGLSNGFIPKQLTPYPDDTPSDTKGNHIAFTSFRDGDWEAYVMHLNGSGATNLSNNPTSSDGLPTISPDGNYVAYVSDRDKHWAIWVNSINGGEPRKLFDLPTAAPWGDGDRAWINERLSWGP